MRGWVVFLFLGMCITAVEANQTIKKACNNPFWDYSSLSSDTLREIAESCRTPEISNLYFSRAYHADLLKEYQELASLKAYKKSNDRMYIERQNMFIGLAEAFAYEQWKNGNDQVLRELNDSYDQAIEVTEYLLRGNEVLARNSYLNPSL